MTIEDGHFRTDGKEIEPCCRICKKYVPTMFFRVPITSVKQEKCLFILWSNVVQSFDKNLTECPWCGAKLEYVEKLEDSQ